jgi:predicted transcriptional regulator
MPSKQRLLPAGFDARPHRLSSLRAQARRNFRAMAARDDVLKTPAECAAREERNRAGANDSLSLLTALARALYEESCVPISEIARLAGVHERTLYKHARRHRWRRRNVRAMREEIGPRAQLAAAKPERLRSGGAGRGLKARDPAEAERAAVALERAAVLSDRALTRARALREAGGNVRMLATIARMLPMLAALDDAIAAAARRPDDNAVTPQELKRRYDLLIRNRERRALLPKPPRSTADYLRAEQDRRIDAIGDMRRAMRRGDLVRGQ